VKRKNKDYLIYKNISSSEILAQNNIHFNTNNFKMLIIKCLIFIIEPA